MKFNSPIGSALRGLTFMNSNLSLKYKIKGAIIYNCYKLELDKKIDILEVKGVFLTSLVIFTYLFGIIYNKKWKKMVS